MICVRKAVNKLFPELDLSAFEARTVGYGIGELQMMLPYGFIVEPLFVSDRIAISSDLDAIDCEGIIPLFFFTKNHCFLEYYRYKEEERMIGNYKLSDFFNVYKINKICCVLDYETRRMIGI